jgi:hypothetical protein
MEFKSLQDAFTDKGKLALAKYTEANPGKDHIFEFPIERHESLSTVGCLAGSSVVKQVLDSYEGKRKTEWEGMDHDVFFLGMPVPVRTKLGPIDLVHSTAETVPELIARFDLAPCRAARNATTLWISAHCLNAIVTKKYPFPSNLAKFANKQKMNHWLVERTTLRRAKYLQRGFTAVPFETQECPLWLHTMESSEYEGTPFRATYYKSFDKVMEDAMKF